MTVSTLLNAHLRVTDIINWQHPDILDLAKRLGSKSETANEIAKICFQWVRDEIRHSYDYQTNPLTCRASDVLHYRTGYCYAKSHLLAALLRANGIPTGFCYQRLSLNEQGAPYCLHGLNAVYLPETGWYRVDARGNRDGVDAQFIPPQEQLAFKLKFFEEANFPAILAEPLKIIVEALHTYNTWDELLNNLPDISLDVAERYGLWKTPAETNII
ncbi:MAG: transglutaminase family protein [Cyanobacteria bacterium P01_F01_bin.13]